MDSLGVEEEEVTRYWYWLHHLLVCRQAKENMSTIYTVCYSGMKQGFFSELEPSIMDHFWFALSSTCLFPQLPPGLWFVLSLFMTLREFSFILKTLMDCFFSFCWKEKLTKRLSCIAPDFTVLWDLKAFSVYLLQFVCVFWKDYSWCVIQSRLVLLQ